MQTEKKLENYYTIRETAEKLKINTHTLHNWIRSGQISCYRSGRRYLFSENNILNYLNKNRINDENE